MRYLSALVIVSLLGACRAAQTPPSPSQTLKWFTTCGDPVCGQPGASPAPATCGDRVEGAACSVAGQTCELGNACHQKLICAEQDPKLQPGGCPISRPIYKQQIHFIQPAERAKLAQKLERLPLATWHYRFEPQGPARLGFMIAAGTPAELVKPDGNSVDLYGYMSLAVAAIQEQHQQIETLQQRVTQLETALKRCPAGRR